MHPSDDQPPAGLSATWGLATLRAYLVFYLLSISNVISQHGLPDRGIAFHNLSLVPIPRRQMACVRCHMPHAFRYFFSVQDLIPPLHLVFRHGRMARGAHGLSKVLFGPAMPYPSTPCEQATPETARQLFQGWPTHRAGGLRPSSTLLDTPRCMSMPPLHLVFLPRWRMHFI
jgi:hypothetical protein